MSGPGRFLGIWGIVVADELAGATVVSIWTCILHLTSSIGVLSGNSNPYQPGRPIDYKCHNLQNKARDSSCPGSRDDKLRESQNVSGCPARHPVQEALQLPVGHEQCRIFCHGADNRRGQSLDTKFGLNDLNRCIPRMIINDVPYTTHEHLLSAMSEPDNLEDP